MSQGRIYLLFAVFSINLIVIVGFFIPIGEKYNYTEIIKRAQYHLEKLAPSEEKPIIATLAVSQRDCYKCDRYRADYETLVVINNTTNQGLWVEMKIDFLNRQERLSLCFQKRKYRMKMLGIAGPSSQMTEPLPFNIHIGLRRNRALLRQIEPVKFTMV